MFASLNSCRGNNKSRRDDIESAFYLILYILNKNFLPWQEISNDKSFVLKLIERLDMKYTQQLFDICPSKLSYFLTRFRAFESLFEVCAVSKF